MDRYYIENFLERHAADIGGRVLEIGENRYTARLGGPRVVQTDVLHVIPDNPNATIVADLTAADHIASDSFDCIILTQTLQMIYDTRAAIQTLHRILKRGGVLLATLPGIAPISRYDMERWGDYWRFTTVSAQRLFETSFRPTEIRIEAHGNLVTATAFLCGLAAEDLNARELHKRDQDYEVIIAIRASKEE